MVNKKAHGYLKEYIKIDKKIILPTSNGFTKISFHSRGFATTKPMIQHPHKRINNTCKVHAIFPLQKKKIALGNTISVYFKLSTTPPFTNIPSLSN